ncbi:hypothetical protein IPL68_07510 [Candidatus Saccharibacteria bacterium]|nr:MAG: hypothetical protein IPL68_07510 [Candidatus Saccharibacteria bacterium]
MKGQVNIELDIPSVIDTNLLDPEDMIVSLGQIGFVVTKNRPVETQLQPTLERMAKQYNLPAFGLVWTSPKGIVPFVFVRDTSSFVRETACGSGSLAAYIVSDAGSAGVDCDIFQPTGKAITIRRKLGTNTFRLAARVNEVVYEELGIN